MFFPAEWTTLTLKNLVDYQTLINDALRAFIKGQRQPTLEQTLRKVIREELRRAS
jgi:DNA-binding HxlR family transcriptional regulator